MTIDSVSILSQRFERGELVAFVDANNRLRYGKVMFQTHDGNRVELMDEETGNAVRPTVDRVAHLTKEQKRFR